jgi:hypothetical protein
MGKGSLKKRRVLKRGHTHFASAYVLLDRGPNMAMMTKPEVAAIGE